MGLVELVGLIEALRQRAQAYAGQLQQSEALTRYALIDPLLRALGWDTADPSQVWPEYKAGAGPAGQADYALLKADGKPGIFIEAKALDRPLAEGLNQGINYCNQTGTPYFAVSNGRQWKIYDVFRPVPIDQKVIVEFDISGAASKAAFNALGALWRPLLHQVGPSPPVIIEQPQPGTVPNGAAPPPPLPKWTPDEVKRLWGMLTPGARQVLKEIATKPEGYRSKELQEKLGLRSAPELAGRLSSIGHNLKKLPEGLPYPLQDKWLPEGLVYQMLAEVAEAIQKLDP